MRYRKANNILPEELVELIQKYVDGEYVYIPRKQENKKNWGESSNVREELHARNQKIYEEYVVGTSVKELAAMCAKVHGIWQYTKEFHPSRSHGKSMKDF